MKTPIYIDTETIPDQRPQSLRDIREALEPPANMTTALNDRHRRQKIRLPATKPSVPSDPAHTSPIGRP